MSSEADPRIRSLARARNQAFLVGLAGAVACVAGAFVDPQQLVRSWLPAWLLWVGVSVGCLAILMLHHLAGGQWGVRIRRPLESGAVTIGAMAVLALPVLLGMEKLYHWTTDHDLGHKAAYLNVGFFVARTVVYFAVWIALALRYDTWSAQQDRAPAPLLARRIRGLAGPALLALGLTVTFASIDWAMSLEPHWSSSIYGLMFVAGDLVAALAVVILTVVLLARTSPMREALLPSHLNDLGNLLLAFVMLWAYSAFSQYLIIWSGNLPEETPWYLRRGRGGWQWVVAFVVAFHFFVPFVVLLSRSAKRKTSMLGAVAIGVLVMRQVDLFWLVAPAFRPEAAVHWLDLAAPLAIGGVWVAVFLTWLAGRPVLPLHDHRIEEPLPAAGGA